MIAPGLILPLRSPAVAFIKVTENTDGRSGVPEGVKHSAPYSPPPVVRYRVAFQKRLQTDGQPSPLDATTELDSELADGVVAEKSFVERLESQAEHSQEVLDEDDAFLGLAATEVWEYDVVNGRA